MKNQFPYYGSFNQPDSEKLNEIYAQKFSNNNSFEGFVSKIPLINHEPASHKKYLSTIRQRIEDILNIKVIISDEKDKKIDHRQFFPFKMNTEPLNIFYEERDGILHIDPLFLKNITSYEIRNDASFINSMKKTLGIIEDSRVFLAGSVRTFSDDDRELHFAYSLYRKLKKKYGFERFIFCHRGANEDSTKEFVDLLGKDETYSIVKKSDDDILKIKGGSDPKEILIVESFGILDKLYFVSDLSFIGGSTTGKREGHSIRESLVAGVPFISGKFMNNNGLLFEESIKDGLGVSINETIAGMNKGEIAEIASDIADQRMITKPDFTNFFSSLDNMYKLSLYYREIIIEKILENLAV